MVDSFDYNRSIGMLGQGGSGMTFEGFWRQLTAGFKYMIVATLACAVVGIFTQLLTFAFANIVYYSFNKFQIWRLVTSFLVDASIINVAFNVYILTTILPELEKKYSTSYLILEVLTQNIGCNLIFAFVGEVLALLGLVNAKTFASFGLIPIMFVFLWQRVAVSPQEMTRFCCLPCLMPSKYLPWCFLALFLLFGGGPSTLLSCLLGYYQHMILRRSLIPMPIEWYSKVEAWMPKFIKNDEGFVTVRSVENQLRSISRYAPSSHSVSVNSNEMMSDRVEVAGGGVAIGGCSPSDYRKHWLEQQESNQVIEEAEHNDQKAQQNSFNSKKDPVEAENQQAKATEKQQKKQESSRQLLHTDLI